MTEIAKYFLYLGVTGFGGPLVLIQQMRAYFVTEKKQITALEFDQAFALVKAMPGPVAFQMAVFLGKRFHGFLGACVAGLCLIIPAFLMMILAGYFYDSITAHPSISVVMEGLLYAATAVILLSLKGLVSTYGKEPLFLLFVAINFVLMWNHSVPEPVLIISFGLLAVLLKFSLSRYFFSVGFFLVDWPKIYSVFKTCLYTGGVVFGTGFAMLPVLKSNFVDVQHLLDLKQFSDGVVFGQMTPGPITITATFLGYQVSGIAGAIAATVGIFLLPLFHMSTWFPSAINWLSKQKWISSFVLGATSAVVAGILVLVVHMGQESQSLMFWVIFVTVTGVLLKRPSTSAIVLFLVSGIVNLIAKSYVLN